MPRARQRSDARDGLVLVAVEDENIHADVVPAAAAGVEAAAMV